MKESKGFVFPATVIILGIALLSVAALPPLIRIAREQLQVRTFGKSQNIGTEIDSSENKDSFQRGIKLLNPSFGCKNDLRNRSDAEVEDKGDKWIFKNKFYQFEFPKDLHIVGSPAVVRNSAGLAPC